MNQAAVTIRTSSPSRASNTSTQDLDNPGMYYLTSFQLTVLTAALISS